MSELRFIGKYEQYFQKKHCLKYCLRASQLDSKNNKNSTIQQANNQPFNSVVRDTLSKAVARMAWKLIGASFIVQDKEKISIAGTLHLVFSVVILLANTLLCGRHQRYKETVQYLSLVYAVKRKIIPSIVSVVYCTVIYFSTKI